VISACPCESRVHLLYFQDIHQKLCQLKSLSRKSTCSFQPSKICSKQTRIVFSNHASAGTRGHNHIVKLLKSCNDLPGNTDTGPLVSAVIRRLPTTSLCARHNHSTSCILQQTNCRKPHCRAQEVNNAGYEKPNRCRSAICV
ncbi:uncharacterized protein METZ01_LOCUS9502, partial [marine metagenome]